MDEIEWWIWNDELEVVIDEMEELLAQFIIGNCCIEMRNVWRKEGLKKNFRFLCPQQRRLAVGQPVG